MTLQISESKTCVKWFPQQQTGESSNGRGQTSHDKGSHNVDVQCPTTIQQAKISETSETSHLGRLHRRLHNLRKHEMTMTMNHFPIVD